ncbi:hypothetical protein F5887DRAFT_1077028 [Amanita rubescens]|nr:hypothetical protein F5887DRAFT_1077028 [Amanita rubescens]
MRLWIRRRGLRPSPFAKLPPELVARILLQFARDPDTSFSDLKSLRLVCKKFDKDVRHRVLRCVRLFGNVDNPMSNMLQLKAIISSDLNGRLDATTTLLVGGWKWRHAAGEWRLPMLLYYICDIGIGGLIYLAALLSLQSLYTMLFKPHSVVLGIHDIIARSRTKHRLSHASAHNLPNVRRVIWNVEAAEDPSWVLSGTAKLLLQFPQLSELVLVVDWERICYIHFEPLSTLRNLRKLRVGFLKLSAWDYFYPMKELGKIVAENLNLTHLELFAPGCYDGISRSQVFGQVPVGSVLNLEHLTIPDTIENITPHLRSLTSINFYGGHDRILLTLNSERIFPPFIETANLDDRMIDYLRNHPRIVGLSVYKDFETNFNKPLLEIMARHFESLTHFSVVASLFTSMQNEALFLRCTNLTQLKVLLYGDHLNNEEMIVSGKFTGYTVV